MINVKRTLSFAIILISISCLNACKKDEKIDPNLELYSELDGNYILKSAIADKAYDVNMDGIASTNMLLEIPQLNQSKVDIAVNKVSRQYRIMWSEQKQVIGDEQGGPLYAYVLQGVFNTFIFNKDQGKVSPEGGASAKNNEDLQIQTKDDIKVQVVKLLFTAAGQQKVTINATYTRNTNYHSLYN